MKLLQGSLRSQGGTTRPSKSPISFRSWHDPEAFGGDLTDANCTEFLSAKHAYLRDSRSSLSKGVQLGQVAIYCRVSTDDQCCERQERDLRAFARRAGHHIVGVFKETASGAKNDRVERKKVMALAQARDIALTT